MTGGPLWRKPIISDDGDADEPEPRCPACDSTRILSYHPFVVWLLLPAILPMLIISLVLLPLLPLFIRLLWVRRWYCASCKQRWKEAR
jgi:hypothetical protein